MIAPGRAVLGLAAGLLVAGCAGHESRVRAALDALDRGAPDDAVAALDRELRVETADEVPAELATDDALLLLDRGSIQLWRGDYARAARDLSFADKAIELLDLSRSGADELGKYLLSDDVGPYKAPAFEKLMINTMGLIAWLEQRKLDDAKVEARRLAILQRYLVEHEQAEAMTAAGSYLAGFAFEKAGNVDEALTFYEEALAAAPMPSLRDPLRRLTKGEPRGARSKELVGDAGPLPSLEEAGECDVLAFAGVGRVPQKEPIRIPIGLALTLTADMLSPFDRGRANELAAKGLVTWVNFPSLAKGSGRRGEATIVVDGRAIATERALDVEAEVRAAYAEAEPTIVLAALTRTIARVAVQEAAQGVGKAVGGASGKGGAKTGNALGLLVGLAAAATLSATDTHDTRAWSTLPSTLQLARFRLPAGQHTIAIDARGARRDSTIACTAGGWAFVSLTALR